MVDLNLTLLISELDAQAYIRRQRFGFLLRQGCHDCHQNFSLGIQCIDILLLEEHRDVHVFQLTRIFQAIDGVSGKTADRLGKNHIDLSSFAVLDHPVEAFSLGCVGAGNTVVGIDLNHLPFGITFDVVGVMLDLHLVAGLLLFILCRNTAVCSYSCLLDLCSRLLCSDGASGRNHCNVLC